MRERESRLSRLSRGTSTEKQEQQREGSDNEKKKKVMLRFLLFFQHILRPNLASSFHSHCSSCFWQWNPEKQKIVQEKESKRKRASIFPIQFDQQETTTTHRSLRCAAVRPSLSLALTPDLAALAAARARSTSRWFPRDIIFFALFCTDKKNEAKKNVVESDCLFSSLQRLRALAHEHKHNTERRKNSLFLSVFIFAHFFFRLLGAKTVKQSTCLRATQKTLERDRKHPFSLFLKQRHRAAIGLFFFLVLHPL